MMITTTTITELVDSEATTTKMFPLEHLSLTTKLKTTTTTTTEILMKRLRLAART